MGNSDARRCGATLAVLLAAGSVGAAENKLSLAPLENKLSLAPLIIANAQALFDQFKADLNLTQGEVMIFAMDMPNVPPQDAPMMIAQAGQTQSGNAMAMRTIGVCATAPNHDYSGENGLTPLADINFFFEQYEKRTITGPATITVLQPPKHGVLRLITDADRGTLFSSDSGPLDPADPGYAYLPNTGYIGKDSATLLVDFGGVKVRVKYYLNAINAHAGSDWIKKYCAPKGLLWKISSTVDANGNSEMTAIDYLPSPDGAVTSGIAASHLASALLKGDTDANGLGVNVTFADLAGIKGPGSN